MRAEIAGAVKTPQNYSFLRTVTSPLLEAAETGHPQQQLSLLAARRKPFSLPRGAERLTNETTRKEGGVSSQRHIGVCGRLCMPSRSRLAERIWGRLVTARLDRKRLVQVAPDHRWNGEGTRKHADGMRPSAARLLLRHAKRPGSTTLVAGERPKGVDIPTEGFSYHEDLLPGRTHRLQYDCVRRVGAKKQTGRQRRDRGRQASLGMPTPLGVEPGRVSRKKEKTIKKQRQRSMQEMATSSTNVTLAAASRFGRDAGGWMFRLGKGSCHPR